MELNKVQMPKEKKPPPVVISNCTNYQEIKNRLKNKNLQYSATLMNNNQIKINVNSGTEYRELTKTINETQQQWHTYENKQERPIRIMVRNLHPTCDTEEIKAELEQKGFKILSVENKLKRIKEDNQYKYIKLPLFMLTFDRTEDIKKIHGIQYLAKMKITTEMYKTGKLIPQCKKCQSYGHTQKFCQRNPVCIKCAGNHLSTTCTKSKNTPAKCANCAGSHPANYRGCVIAKELQKRREEQKQKKDAHKTKTFTSKKTTEHIPYNRVVQESHLPHNNSQEQPKLIEDASVHQMMQQMMQMMNKFGERLDRLEARVTGAIPKRK